MATLHGAIAAAVTPMRDGGIAIDVASIGSLTSFLADGGIDGVLACGTTGEGVSLRVEERMEVARAFVAAAPDGFQVAVHAGAQTTRDTVTLAAHARDTGADAIAVIAPPYFPLDEDELFVHLLAAAGACEPLPFYVYESAGRSGYAIPIPVIERLRGAASNLAGMKVSDTPFEAVEPYLLEGLDVFVGSEPLTLRGMAAGAVGAVSGLATAWPETVAALVHDREDAAHQRVTALRDGLAGIPFHAALKEALVAKRVLETPDVRPPLRPLRAAERDAVLALG
ncbi:MAG TPA: dihydrodipicolinate synthase family protein [Actinomycetota bacterium]|nr:dihydrodipicolinate synthase family protein [Actinomycetota bacterium]